ncbi:hypothetical protein [Streptacidiphilus sp. PAMC 29251]
METVLVSLGLALAGLAWTGVLLIRRNGHSADEGTPPPTVPAWLRWPVTITALIALACAGTVVDHALIRPHQWSVSINKGAIFLMIAIGAAIWTAVTRRHRH